MSIDPQRQARILEAIQTSQLQALASVSPPEVLLLTGYWPVMGASLAIVTRDGDVSVSVPEDELDLALATSSANVTAYQPHTLDRLTRCSEAIVEPLQKLATTLRISSGEIGTNITDSVQPAPYQSSNHFQGSLPVILQLVFPGVSVVSADNMLERLKSVRTPGEMDQMRRASKLTEASFREADQAIRAGRREDEVAADIQAVFSRCANDGFERGSGYFFCMSGPNAAKAAGAYARTRRRVIEDGDLVMIHANTVGDGFWTDITRTFVVGDPSDQQTKMRDAIDQASTAALQAIAPGVAARTVDQAARDVLKEHGFGADFKHATGHGVGLAATNPNALPRIHPQSPDVLVAGMTFNIEPAIYIDGVGGMRHCDVVACTDSGPEVLTSFSGKDSNKPMKQEFSITDGSISFFTVPTDAPEADGTFSWESTSMVLVQLSCGSTQALGYTYADAGTAATARKLLNDVVIGSDPLCHAATLQKMLRHIRNLGETGIAMMAVSAIDNALWDLRAKLMDLSLVSLLGQVRTGIPVYGSGGFTTYSDQQLSDQLGGWAAKGFASVKMKIGTHPDKDPARVETARSAIGNRCNLFVDANGAYTVMQAIELAQRFAAQGVRWFEEPVSSDNLVGLRQVRERAPVGMDIAAGEYGYTAWYFRAMLHAEAVTVLQADCTRCGGISGFLDAAALCWAHNIPLSSHCGPSMHLHVCCAVPRAVHMEFFHDHIRIERMFFDGFCEPVEGCMIPDLSRAGMGLELREKDAARFRV